jgi:hypothetical protein
VLLTGMSGTGKSTLVRELRQRGYAAHDAGEGFAESRADGRWGWRADLLAHADGLLFFAGCSEEQADLPFDFRVLLTAPRSVIMERLRSRTDNLYGRTDDQLAQLLADRGRGRHWQRHSSGDAVASPGGCAQPAVGRRTCTTMPASRAAARSRAAA